MPAAKPVGALGGVLSSSCYKPATEPAGGHGICSLAEEGGDDAGKDIARANVGGEPLGSAVIVSRCLAVSDNIDWSGKDHCCLVTAGTPFGEGDQVAITGARVNSMTVPVNSGQAGNFACISPDNRELVTG